MKHSSVSQPKAKSKINQEDYSDPHLPELFFSMVQMKGVFVKCIIHCIHVHVPLSCMVHCIHVHYSEYCYYHEVCDYRIGKKIL